MAGRSIFLRFITAAPRHFSLSTTTAREGKILSISFRRFRRCWSGKEISLRPLTLRVQRRDSRSRFSIPRRILHFPNNTIPQINPVAAGLLAYIPMPNLPGDFQNFHFVTSANSSSDDLNMRINHTFGAAPASGSAWRRGGRGAPRNNLTFGSSLSRSETPISRILSRALAASTSVRSLTCPSVTLRSIGKLTNSLRFDFNRSRTHTQNLYAFSDNIASASGNQWCFDRILSIGVCQTLSFTDFASLQDQSATAAQPDLHILGQCRLVPWQTQLAVGWGLSAHGTQQRSQ